MPVVYCKINMFDLDQIIYIKYEDGNVRTYAKTPYSELDKTLCKTCETENINEIYLNGNKFFTEGMREKINKFCAAHYGQNNKITVHITGEDNE